MWTDENQKKKKKKTSLKPITKTLAGGRGRDAQRSDVVYIAIGQRRLHSVLRERLGGARRAENLRLAVEAVIQLSKSLRPSPLAAAYTRSHKLD
ncbi:hypothetical protein EVAR_75647_1 [Eumeta japonica]|uniref:Uncharacterized protein n=1 Tax=Eumeta variegata TaxID=151549 RepID=A0A4C1U029_EUMVA|nr:hypothetical protein EVAR_75647_1 [Eumeta japonica]